jgi:integrase
MDREQMELDKSRPTSIRDIVIGELASTTHKGKTIPKPEKIEDLLKRVYEHIERQALEVYKSNEPWALRRWALENLLKEEVVSEASVDIADGLLSPVLEWQKEQPLDPIDYYRHRLTHTLRRSPATIRAYMVTAARFVGKFGRKRHYSDEEVMQYLDWAGEHFSKSQSSYVHECQRLVQFLRNLPGANRQRQLPIPMPQMPDEFNQPMLTDEQIEMAGWACVLDRIRPNLVVRIAVASIYGGRKGELAQLSSDDFYLDGDKSYIYIATTKRGVKKKQPIPPSLVPLFSVPIEPVQPPTLHYRLRKALERAEIPWRHGMGFHSFRRNVVTMLDGLGTQSDISIHKFMRWSTPRHLGMLDRYRRTPTEVSDMKILEQHPRVKMWEEIIPYLAKYNPYYRSGIDILT